MEYLNTAVRSTANAVAHRLSIEPTNEQAHLRIQTGYFSLNGLAGLKANIDHLAQNDLPITIALGANDKATIKPDVDALYTLIACPRPLAKLCVISCVGGLFHPKVIHLTRTDGSQLAYVGSANITPSGLNGSNIEAGILLDSRTGDPLSILQEIAASIDDWFTTSKTGVTNIINAATTSQLVTDGVLGIVKPPISTGGASASGSATPRMPLKPLVSYTPLVGAAGASVASGGGVNAGASGSGVTAGSPAPATPISLPSVVSSAAGLEILIAEIGRGDRWKQANFPYNIVQTFFGMNPTGNGIVNLIPILSSGAAGAAVPTQVVSVKSKNYRLELGSVSGMAYPAAGRPIAVFRTVSAGNFRYAVFFPGHPGHGALNAGLSTLYTGPARELKRVVTDSPTLSGIWGGCPV